MVELSPIERLVLSGPVIRREPMAHHRQVGVRPFRANPLAFEPDVLAAPLPNGAAAYVDSTTYEVKVVSSLGGIDHAFRRPFTPRQVTDEIKASWRDSRLALAADLVAGLDLDDLGVDAGVFGDALDALEFNDEIPVIRALTVDWDGYLWVERTGDMMTAEGLTGGDIDIWRVETGYVGTLPPGSAMPASFGPGGLVAFVELDDYDVPTVVVKRSIYPRW